ncbi:MAG: hypothetical protein OXE77_03485 [Flavobacteriaceae bacterium]|nr:hypothetical protein [Flavobacteriaceae bacterium]MCY4266665.1 hypothetical protein [Flavobacteriaceae bacterium]MCY4299378.1 hypothetical protein [Flavobacteriaceae bacterium]
MFDNLALDDGFPYNINQKRLHYSEEKRLQDIEWKVNKYAKTKEDESRIRSEELAKIKEIKSQIPHPAKVFAHVPCIFWDIDVYWLHWDWSKSLIIPRMTNAYGPSLSEDSFDERVRTKYAKKSVEFLEDFYAIEDIEPILRKTGEIVNPLAYKILSKKYKLKNFISHNWCEVNQ